MFHKILIAIGAEIELRIIDTCRELGIRSVVAHSKADTDSLPVRLADESICVGPDVARLSYLNIPAIISAAAVTDSEAIHPGYGFLAENAAFAEVCRACSITFIGPSPEAIRLMGDKAQARQLANQAGVAVVPGSELPLKDAAEAVDVADRIGYPIIFKAAAGGGGRGMRIVRRREDAAQAFDACQAEAGSAFGSQEIYCEKFVERARHVEVQVLGDKNGIRVHLGERECSVQRRHQKLLEESPAPNLGAETRAGLHRAALTVAAAVNYMSAGTVEFSVDSHLMAPYSVPPFYDSLLAKVIVRGADRAEAIGRMRRALAETVVEGVKTSIPFHLKVLNDPAFLEGRFTSVDTERLRG